MDFIPDPSLQQKAQTSSGFIPDNSLSFNQSSAALGHSNSQFTKTIGMVPGASLSDNLKALGSDAVGALPTFGAIGGGIAGAAGGAFVGGPVGAYAGGVAGSGAGAAGGEALKEGIQGGGLNPGEIAKQGGIYAGLEAIGGPIAGLAGKALKGVGEAASKFFIPTSAKEATQMQAYKAANPLVDRVWNSLTGAINKPPATAGSTAFQKGLVGTESMIGIQARRASTGLWKNTIEPALKNSPVKQDMPTFFSEAASKITQSTKELGDRSLRLDALEAIQEEYKANPTATMEELQGYKEGWASHVPEKYYKGKDITQTYNNVRAELASLARSKIYDAVGPEAKQAYFDYGNLQAVQQLGQSAMTGSKLKGGAGSFISGLKEMLTVPVGTVGGQTVYKIGQGVEMLGKPGARTVRDLIYGYTNPSPDTNSSPNQ